MDWKCFWWYTAKVFAEGMFALKGFCVAGMLIWLVAGIICTSSEWAVASTKKLDAHMTNYTACQNNIKFQFIKGFTRCRNRTTINVTNEHQAKPPRWSRDACSSRARGATSGVRWQPTPRRQNPSIICVPCQCKSIYYSIMCFLEYRASSPPRSTRHPDPDLPNFIKTPGRFFQNYPDIYLVTT